MSLPLPTRLVIAGLSVRAAAEASDDSASAWRWRRSSCRSSPSSAASTWPSATVSPGRTSTRSPVRTSASGTGTSCPSRRTVAVSGRSARSPSSAPSVRRLARASSHLPNSTSVTTTAEASKYRCTMAPGAALSHNHMDKVHPAVVPMATSKSILPVSALSACQPAL